MEELILNLFDVGCIEFGKFTLKSQIVSPIYIDFKAVVSYPENSFYYCISFNERLKTLNLPFKRICGVPGGIVFIICCHNQLENQCLLFVKKLSGMV